MAAGVGPLAGFHIYSLADQPDFRSSVENGFGGCERFFTKNRISGQPAQDAHLEKIRTGFRHIDLRPFGLAGFQVEPVVGQAGRRIEGCKHPRTEIRGQIQHCCIR